MDITYDYYRVFYYVCRYESFTKAAQILNGSQPNITRTINNLESQLGVKLFIRSKKGVVPTEEGKRLYNRISIAFEQICLAEKELEGCKNLEAGLVTIGVSEIALHEVLLPTLSEFRKDYPKISVKITNESTPSALKGLNDGMVDFALVTTPIEREDEYECVILKEFREFLVAPKDYNLPSDTMNLREICNYPLIMMADKTGTRAFYDSVFLDNNVELSAQMIAATADQILPMIRAGLGIGFVPEILFDDDSKLKIITLIEEIPHRKICLVMRKGQEQSIASKRIVEYLKLNRRGKK